MTNLGILQIRSVIESIYYVWGINLKNVPQNQNGLKLYYKQTIGILSSTEFRTFWIKTEDTEDHKFTISVGKDGEKNAFISYTWEKQMHQINFVSFGCPTGEWNIIEGGKKGNTIGTKNNVPVTFHISMVSGTF